MRWTWVCGSRALVPAIHGLNTGGAAATSAKASAARQAVRAGVITNILRAAAHKKAWQSFPDTVMVYYGLGQT